MIDEFTAPPKTLASMTDDEHGAELCERWADWLALARMHFNRGDLKACEQAIKEAERYSVLAWHSVFSHRSPN
jgi:hypothetical protein